MNDAGFTFPPLDKSQWRAIIEKDLNGADYSDRMVTHTPSGLAIQPLYTDEDWPHRLKSSGLPGISPYTRGTVTPVQAGTWEIRQEYSHPDPRRAREIIHQDLANGVDAIVLRLDPTGTRGIMIRTTAQLDMLLADVDLEAVPVHIQAGSLFKSAAMMLGAVWDKRGLEPERRRGGYYIEPLSILATRGALPFSLQQQLMDMSALAAEAARSMPGVCAAKISTKPYHNAGASAEQELGFVLAIGLSYLKAMDVAGLDLSRAAGQLHVCMNAGCDFYRDIAKLRAVRTLWARLVESCGGDQDAQRLPVLTRTSQRILTRCDPWVNILRATTGVFAAALGGSNMITTTPHDTLIGVSGEFSHRVARNIQILLREESHLGHVIDPAGGCWHLESLTDDLCEKGWSFFQRIEAEGGMAEVLDSGWALEQIDVVHQKRARDIATRKIPITGVSEYPLLAEMDPEVETVDLEALRADQPDAADLLAPDGGPQVEVRIFPVRRYAEPYERLREASDVFLSVEGVRPRVFLANLGPVAKHTARANFAVNFLNAGGIEVLGNAGYNSVDEVRESFVASGATIAVICSSDEIYAESVAEYATALKTAGADTVLLAGRMGENADVWREAGIDMSIHLGCDALAILEDLLRRLEVIR